MTMEMADKILVGKNLETDCTPFELALLTLVKDLRTQHKAAITELSTRIQKLEEARTASDWLGCLLRQIQIK